MSRKAIQIENRAKDKLYGYVWSPENQENLVGNIIIITGMQETAERYDDFAKFLVKNNYAVYCIDHYGQGLNAGPTNDKLGIWPESAFRKFVNTVDDLVVKLRLTCRPTYIIGHSMGSFILQDYIQRYTEHVAKVILIGTGRKPYAPSLGYALAKMTVPRIKVDKKTGLPKTTRKTHGWNKKNPTLHKLALGNVNKLVVKQHKEDIKSGVKSADSPAPHQYAWLSCNGNNIKAYASNPQCGGVNAGGFYREFFKGLSRLHKKKFLKKIRPSLSILIVGGKEDPIGNYGKELVTLHKQYRSVGVRDVRLRLYDNMRHEVLNETEKEKVYNDILNFIKEK